MPSAHPKPDPRARLTVERSATVVVWPARETDHAIDRSSARRWAVELAASNALDALPAGFEPVSVRVIGRRKRGAS